MERRSPAVCNVSDHKEGKDEMTKASILVGHGRAHTNRPHFSSYTRQNSGWEVITLTPQSPLMQPYPFTAYAIAFCSAGEGRAKEGRIIIRAAQRAKGARPPGVTPKRTTFPSCAKRSWGRKGGLAI